MDYVGKKGSFHLNWTKQYFVYCLLAQLGADLEALERERKARKLETVLEAVRAVLGEYSKVKETR
ncbi:MAG: hypothetical protein KGI38_02380 [Thaumarchaeota archaeon]|nr:hypothetical protein [Nitrososphaerota archaeon]